MSKQIKLFTPVNIPTQQDKISSTSKVLTLGSCFSDNMGNKLSNHLFDAMVNPFGTVFNPVSLGKVLKFALTKNSITDGDLNAVNNRHFHYDFHSSFDSSNPIQVVENINDAIQKAGEFIPNTDFLVLTFGTSIVYKLKEENSIVSNCHKVPNTNFEKELLSVDLMQQKVVDVIDLIRKINPSIRIILTVSPIRHTKEGLTENSLSKSRLIDLCHGIVSEKKAVSYFPAFEIMIDELRDYRYYGSDLIHPSSLAVDIIWSRFVDAYFDTIAKQKITDISELNAAKNHRPFDSESEEHQAFKRKQLEKIDHLKNVYPEIDFVHFKEYFTN